MYFETITLNFKESSKLFELFIIYYQKEKEEKETYYYEYPTLYLYTTKEKRKKETLAILTNYLHIRRDVSLIRTIVIPTATSCCSDS